MTTIIKQIVPDSEQENIKIIVRDNERGPAGKDGAIQYKAGAGIKIEDDTISVYGQPGGSVDWGTIGGTLSNQTDLTNALNNVESSCNSATDTKLTEYTKTSGLASVAISGSYADLTNKPTIQNITMTTTDPGEGATLAANNFIAVYEA